MGPGPDAGRDLSGSRPVGRLLATAVALSTVVVLLAAAVLLLMTPLYMHAALERAGSPAYLGITADEAAAISDATIGELLVGPGTFAIPFGSGTFYDADEASHLRDARTVLWGLLLVAAVGTIVLVLSAARSRREARYWRAISTGAGLLAAGFLVIGALFLVAFDAAFTLFHELFFPGGNWAFDFATQRMVQLYPIPFWQEATAGLGAIVVVVGGLVWWLARRHARRLAAAASSAATAAEPTAAPAAP